MPDRILRIVFWSKIKKRNVAKTANIDKKFDGDEEKAQEFLDNWKKEQKEKEEGLLKQPKAEPEQEHNTDITQTPFELNIKPLTKTGSSTIIVGGSQSGKTTLVKHILKKYYDNDDVITFVFAQNVHAHIYNDLPKNIIKHDKFDKEFIKDVLAKIQKKTKNKYAFCVVIDDTILKKNDSSILELVLTLRNSKISVIYLMQGITLLNKHVRYNSNNDLFLRFNNPEGQEAACKHFLNGYGPFYKNSLDEKTELYRKLTEDYSFIYLDALNGKLSYHSKVPE